MWRWRLFAFAPGRDFWFRRSRLRVQELGVCWDGGVGRAGWGQGLEVGAKEHDDYEEGEGFGGEEHALEAARRRTRG